VVIFGGATGDTGKYIITGDTYALDLISSKWSKLEGKAIHPSIHLSLLSQHVQSPRILASKRNKYPQRLKSTTNLNFFFNFVQALASLPPLEQQLAHARSTRFKWSFTVAQLEVSATTLGTALLARIQILSKAAAFLLSFQSILTTE
jgi:hypothetical protein